MSPTAGTVLGRVFAGLLRRPAATALVATLAVYATPLVLGDVYLGVDHTRVLLAALCGARGVDGVVLDRELGGGGPLLEDPQGLLLSPVAWLLRPLPVELAASLFSVVHLALGAAAMVLLARSFGLRRRAALVAGLVWPLTGTCVNLILHGAYVADAAGLPLAWAGARRALAGRTDGALLLAAGLALLGLSGELQGVALALLVVGAEVAAAAVRERRRRRPRAARRLVALVLGAGVGALAAGAVASLALGLATASARADGVSDLYAWPLALPELLGVAWPNAVTTRDAVGASLQTSYAGQALLQPPWNGTPYLGVPLIAAAVLGLTVSRRRRSARGVAVLAGLCSLGAATPVYPALLAVLPPLAMFRYPSKYFLLATVALVVVGIAAADLATRLRWLRRALLATLVVAAGASGVALAVVLARTDVIAAAAAAVAVRAPVAWAPPLATLLIVAGVTATSFASLTALLCASRAPRLQALVLAVVLVDVGASALAALPTGAPLLSDAAALRDVAPAGGWPEGAVVCLGAGLGARRLDLPDRDLGVAGDIVVDLFDGKPNIGQCTGVAVPNTYLPSAQAATIALSRNVFERGVPDGMQRDGLQAARALGCTHLVSRESIAATDRLRRLERTPGAPHFAAGVFALAGPAPDVSIAKAPVLHDGAESALGAVLGSSGVEQALRQLDAPGVDVRYGAPASLPSGEGARASATFTSATRGRLRVDGAGAVVVLRRPWWPGFVAESETGRGLPVLRAAGALLAVVVDDEEAGRDIQLRYRVRGAPLAILCALLACALLGVLCALQLAARR